MMGCLWGGREKGLGRKGLCVNIKRGGGRVYFFMVLLEGRGWLGLGNVVLTGFRVVQKSRLI